MNKLTMLQWFACLMLYWVSLGWADTTADLLPPEQAFQLSAKVQHGDKVMLSWDIAEGYYLYRHKFKFKSETTGINLKEPTYPAGLVKQDKFFGDVEIYKHHVEVVLPLQRQDPKVRTLVLAVGFQECAEIGVCYMPMQQSITLDLSDEPFIWLGKTDVSNTAFPYLSEQNRLANSLNNGSVWFIVASFLGLGVLLAFTPCIFPMLPILSGIIIGQGAVLSTGKAFILSMSFAMASALTYTGFGVLAGLFGSNLQALFQQPWAIIAVSITYVFLALSMLGFFQLQMPTVIQTKLNAMSAMQGGSFWGAALLGLLSTLAIGPCVTAPLAGVLIYIGQTGDALLGGLALFSLGFGMGIPLLIIGTYSRKLLPKAGAWLNCVKVIFSWGLLAVALWLLTRLLSPTVSLTLWLAWLILPVLGLLFKKHWQRAGLLLVTYSLLFGVGFVTNQGHVLNPLVCNVVLACEQPPTLRFEKITSVEALQQHLAVAQVNQQGVMLDFYADWCTACKEMAIGAFSDPKVINALSKVILLQADVTENLPATQTLLKHFKLIGPPAVLFFGLDQQERTAYRVVGNMEAGGFLEVITRVYF